MAFTDNPAVDRYSEASEESVNATKPLFSQRNGFLVREETPDKGVDFDVELILDKQVSGFKFAIQLKSVQNLKTVVKDGISYISYQFKTSRLGYLIRRKPGFGLLVIYDDSNKILYFDYVENIFIRIMEEQESKEWQNNETVTVHIDCNNTLDKDSVLNVHEKMKLRHLNFNEMYERKASDFDLPTFDRDELKDPIAVLEKYGYALFNEQNYQVIYAKLAEMTTGKILGNPKILLLAAITNFQIGYHADGDYYFKKCGPHLNEYGKEEKTLLYVCKSTSDFNLGNINRFQHVEQLKQHLADVKGKTISIFIGLKLLFQRLHDIGVLNDTPFEDIFKDVQALTNDLHKMDTTQDIRCHYLLEIASFIHEIGIQHFLKTSARTKIQKAMLGEAPFQERLAHAQVLIECFGKPQLILKSVADYAKEKNEYLLAVVLFKRCYMMQSFMLQSLFSTYSGQSSLEAYKKTAPKRLLKSAYKDVLIAHDLFIKKMDYISAYKCLTVSMEADYLYSFLYSTNIDSDLYRKVETEIESLERDLGLPKNVVLAENVIVNLTKKRDQKLFNDNYDIPEKERNLYAKFIVESIGLPEDRIDNILFDIEFMRRANAAIDGKYFEVLQNLRHTKAKETYYREKPTYVIRCKGCGYETTESNDLEALLQCLRTWHSHVCL